MRYLPEPPATHPGLMQMPSELMNAAEVAKRLRVPISWVRKHGAEIPGVVRLGKYIRWNTRKLEEFIAAGGLG